jgi:hypothetical protein
MILSAGSATIDRFVLIGTSPPGNDLIHFLESHPYSFPIELWTSETLFNLVAASKHALSTLGIREPPASLPSPAHIYLPSGPLSFDLIHPTARRANLLTSGRRVARL